MREDSLDEEYTRGAPLYMYTTLWVPSMSYKATRGTLVNKLCLVHINSKYFGYDTGTMADDVVDSRDDLITQGILFGKRGMHHEALECYKKCLKLCDSLGDSVGVALSQGNIASQLMWLGEDGKAIEANNRAMEIFRSLDGFENEMINALNLGGILLMRQNKDEESANMFNEALLFASEVNNESDLVGSIYGNLGVLSEKWKNCEESLRNFQQALKIFEKNGNQFSSAIALTNIGNAHLEQNNIAQAYKFYSEALILRETIQDRKGIAESLMRLSNIAHLHGDYSKQNALMDDANEILNSLGLEPYS